MEANGTPSDPDEARDMLMIALTYLIDVDGYTLADVQSLIEANFDDD